MIILGLGSNLTDRVNNLRKAYQAIQNIPLLKVMRVSPIYRSNALLPHNALTAWDKPYLNVCLLCQTSLSPFDLLDQIKKIERQLGRQPTEKWGPRIIDIDILAFNDVIISDEKLTIPHAQLHKRPFAMWPFADIAPFWIYPAKGKFQGKCAAEIAETFGSRFSGDPLLQTQQISHRIDTPQLMGILNLTPDSFSDGGLFLSEENAMQQINHLIESGAEIIDIGAQSTRPNAERLSGDTEWQRLFPVLEALIKIKDTYTILPKLSIDTYHDDVAENALKLGVDWINDVSGLENKKLCDLLIHKKCDVVFMHHVGIPANKNNRVPLSSDVVSTVYQWAENRLNQLIQQGFDPSRLIFDPGIGYGKTKEQSLQLIQHIDAFKKLGIRLLVGHSRKSFFSQFNTLTANERDLETVAISLYLAKREVDYLRVHDVNLHTRALKVTQAVELA